MRKNNADKDNERTGDNEIYYHIAAILYIYYIDTIVPVQGSSFLKHDTYKSFPR